MPATAAVMVLGVAATCSGETRRLTLDNAVALALKQNAVVKLAQLKAREAAFRVKAARAGYYPALSNEMSAVHLGTLLQVDVPRGAMGVFTATGPILRVDVPIPLGKHNLLLTQTTVTQPITHVFRIRAGVDVAKADASSASGKLARDCVRRVRSTFRKLPRSRRTSIKPGCRCCPKTTRRWASR